MIQAKEYPEKKISDAGIPVFDEESLPIKEGGMSISQGEVYSYLRWNTRRQTAPANAIGTPMSAG